jgi:hypothetical protein
MNGIREFVENDSRSSNLNENSKRNVCATLRSWLREMREAIGNERPSNARANAVFDLIRVTRISQSTSFRLITGVQGEELLHLIYPESNGPRDSDHTSHGSNGSRDSESGESDHTSHESNGSRDSESGQLLPPESNGPGLNELERRNEELQQQLAEAQGQLQALRALSARLPQNLEDIGGENGQHVVSLNDWMDFSRSSIMSKNGGTIPLHMDPAHGMTDEHRELLRKDLLRFKNLAAVSHEQYRSDPERYGHPGFHESLQPSLITGDMRSGKTNVCSDICHFVAATNYRYSQIRWNIMFSAVILCGPHKINAVTEMIHKLVKRGVPASSIVHTLNDRKRLSGVPDHEELINYNEMPERDPLNTRSVLVCSSIIDLIPRSANGVSPVESVIGSTGRWHDRKIIMVVDESDYIFGQSGQQNMEIPNNYVLEPAEEDILGDDFGGEEDAAYRNMTIHEKCSKAKKGILDLRKNIPDRFKILSLTGTQLGNVLNGHILNRAHPVLCLPIPSPFIHPLEDFDYRTFVDVRRGRQGKGSIFEEGNGRLISFFEKAIVDVRGSAFGWKWKGKEIRPQLIVNSTTKIEAGGGENNKTVARMMARKFPDCLVILVAMNQAVYFGGTNYTNYLRDNGYFGTCDKILEGIWKKKKKPSGIIQVGGTLFQRAYTPVCEVDNTLYVPYCSIYRFSPTQQPVDIVAQSIARGAHNWVDENPVHPDGNREWKHSISTSPREFESVRSYRQTEKRALMTGGYHDVSKFRKIDTDGNLRDCVFTTGKKRGAIFSKDVERPARRSRVEPGPSITQQAEGEPQARTDENDAGRKKQYRTKFRELGLTDLHEKIKEFARQDFGGNGETRNIVPRICNAVLWIYENSIPSQRHQVTDWLSLEHVTQEGKWQEYTDGNPKKELSMRWPRFERFLTFLTQ